MAAADDAYPDEVQTELLRACLLDAPEAGQAWQQFVKLCGDARLYFEVSQRGIKGLLPFVESRLAECAIPADPEFRTYARVAFVREELRLQIYRQVLQTICSQLRARGVSYAPLRGTAISERYYPPGALRHNHAIVLLVKPTDLAAASEAVEASSCELDGVNGASSATTLFCHESGLAVEVRTRLFDMPYLREPPGLWSETLAGHDHEEKSLPLEHALLHVLGHAAFSQTRANLRWVCDCWYLAAAMDGSAWQRLPAAATSIGLCFPALAMLRYLKRIGAPIPDETLARLVDPALPAPRRTTFAFLLGLEKRRLPRPPWPLLERLRYLCFRAVPPPAYLRWKFPARGALELAGLYARRPLRFLARSLSKRGTPPRPGEQEPALRTPPS